MKYILSITFLCLAGFSMITHPQKSSNQNMKCTSLKLEKQISVNGIYEHYSGKRYVVLSVGRLTESDSLEPHVVYKALYIDPTFGDGQVWIRPLSMFWST